MKNLQQIINFKMSFTNDKWTQNLPKNLNSNQAFRIMLLEQESNLKCILTC